MLYVSGRSTNFYWIFYKVETNKFIITNDEELKNGALGDLLDDGYEIIWDSALSKDIAKELVMEQIHTFLDWYQRDIPLERLLLEEPKPLMLETVPLSFKQACEFINTHHRHHQAPQGHRFSVGLSDGKDLVGVAIAGNPVNRYLDDSRTLEITRCCMKSSIYKNGVSKLLSAVYQAGKALGYKRIISYTLEEETGISLKASGFYLDGISEGGSWNCRSRKRTDKAPTGPKKRWVKKIS
ncbi:XF1762 family protein [Robertmurraya sp. FSL R5-0851]|uniref:XF1762 family protein n=1 Tax=Robertmurraya sp. FSL R5-0851 TaxID=2921584 RepID=UPI0030F7AE4D